MVTTQDLLYSIFTALTSSNNYSMFDALQRSLVRASWSDADWLLRECNALEKYSLPSGSEGYRLNKVRFAQVPHDELYLAGISPLESDELMRLGANHADGHPLLSPLCLATYELVENETTSKRVQRAITHAYNEGLKTHESAPVLPRPAASYGVVLPANLLNERDLPPAALPWCREDMTSACQSFVQLRHLRIAARSSEFDFSRHRVRSARKAAAAVPSTEHHVVEILEALRGTGPVRLNDSNMIYLLTTTNETEGSRREAFRILSQRYATNRVQKMLPSVALISAEDILSTRSAKALNVVNEVPWRAIEGAVAESSSALNAHLLRFVGDVPPSLLETCFRDHPGRPEYRPMLTEPWRVYSVNEASTLVSEARARVTELNDVVLRVSNGDRFLAALRWYDAQTQDTSLGCPALAPILAKIGRRTIDIRAYDEEIRNIRAALSATPK